MSDLQSSDDEVTIDSNVTISQELIENIKRISTQYAAALHGGPRPKLDNFLSQIEPWARERLRKELNTITNEFLSHNVQETFADTGKHFSESSTRSPAVQKLAGTEEPKFPEAVRAQEPADATLVAPPPQTFSQFKLLEIAGTGGFSVVWRALDLNLGRDVAVKIPRSGRVDLSGVTREAQVAAKLRHPNIVTVHNVGEEHGISFIVTDYIAGTNLKVWNSKQWKTPRKLKKSVNLMVAARVVAKVAGAIQYAHDKEVIHRDLKSANVLMDEQGEPHVVDFGIAKREFQEDALEVDGQIVGTPAYMAPEQARADHAAVDRRTDVYSLGAILYELITGQTPFQGDVQQVLEQIRKSAPAAPRTLNPKIPHDLQDICLKCLAKQPDDRYASAQALADDLNLFLSGKALRGIPASLINRGYKWVYRNRRYAMTFCLVAFAFAMLSSSLMARRTHGISPVNPLASPMPEVEITTEPPGCEVTFVGIDAQTGEPDPTKITTVPGRTPLTASLAAGDYLVVAVLDSVRFHEVHRHVPESRETTAFAYPYMHFRRQPSGLIKIPKIVIPRPDVSLGMLFCEHVSGVAEPVTRSSTPKSWNFPAIYVDQHEVTAAEYQANQGPRLHGADLIRLESGQNFTLPYFLAVGYLESLGKRLPSAAELYCLTHAAQVEGLEGVNSRPREWSSTKLGGPFSGFPFLPTSVDVHAMSRMAGQGSDPDEPPSLAGFRPERETSHNVGLRGVRSVKPRRSPTDFPSIIKSSSTN